MVLALCPLGFVDFTRFVVTYPIRFGQSQPPRFNNFPLEHNVKEPKCALNEEFFRFEVLI